MDDWTPDQRLRHDATDEQIRERFTLVYIKSEYGMQNIAMFVARELQAATKAEYDPILAALEAKTAAVAGPDREFLQRLLIIHTAGDGEINIHMDEVIDLILEAGLTRLPVTP